MALTSTFAGTTSDSYVATVAEARTLAAALQGLPGLGVNWTAWLAASDAATEKALQVAAQRLRAPVYAGSQQTTTQCLPWPRFIVGRTDLSSDSTLPEAIKEAQVIEAACLLATQSGAQAAADAGITSQSVGSKQTTFARRATPTQYSLPTQSYLQAMGLVLSAGGSGVISVGRT